MVWSKQTVICCSWLAQDPDLLVQIVANSLGLIQNLLAVILDSACPREDFL